MPEYRAYYKYITIKELGTIEAGSQDEALDKAMEILKRDPVPPDCVDDYSLVVDGGDDNWAEERL